jgi:hypothetical protein
MKKMPEIGKYLLRIKSLSGSSKIIILLLLQQVIIFLPVLTDHFNPHRFGDDFVVANSGLHSRYELDFWPTTISEWFSRIQSRFYLTEILRLIVWGFHSNYQLIAVFFCSLWILSLVLLVYILPSQVNYISKVIFILIVGAAPYRYEFMLLPQGDGYILLFLLLVLSLLFIKHSFIAPNIPRNFLRILSVFFFYFSLYLYEIGTVFSIAIMMGIFLIRKNLKVKFRTDILWAFSFPSIAITHSIIIMLSPNPIWNRSKLENLHPLDLFNYLWSFTGNYFVALLRPFASLIWNEHEILRFFKVLLQYSFFSILVGLFIFNLVLMLRKHRIELRSPKKRDRDTRNLGNSVDVFTKITLASIIAVILFSPYIGFLTFAGGFPSRLLLIPTIGFAIIAAAPLTLIKKSNSLLCKFYEGAVLSLILYFTLFSAFLTQSLNSVSKYDEILTSEIVSTFNLNKNSVKYPVLITFPVPACQEVGFWRWNPSIWESNQGNLTLAESLGLLNGQENEFNQIFYLPRSTPLHGNSISTNGNDVSSCSVTQNSPTYFGYHAQEVVYDYNVGIQAQFAFNKELKMYRLSP